MQLTKNFILQEFVSRNIYQQFGNRAVQFLDLRTVKLAQFYVDYFGHPMTVNNWNVGGQFNERGFRDPMVAKIGAPRSMHKLGKAFDGNMTEITPEEMYEEILKNQQVFYDAGLRCLEDIAFTKTWLHSDTRETIGHYIKPGQILIVKP